MGGRIRILPPDDHPGLLNRDHAEAVVREAMGPAYELLFEELKWGLGLFSRAANTAEETRIFDSGLRLFWQYLEALDSTDCLLRAGAASPARVQARSLVEVGLQLLYLLERNDERVAAAHTTHLLRQRLRDARRFVPGSEQRKELESWAKNTKHLPDDFLARYPDSSDQIREIEATLRENLWKEANAELERIGSPPERWFRAYGGPADVRELARSLNMEMWHWAVYASYSQAVHGSTPDRTFIRIGEGELKVRPLRDHEGWETLVTTCHVLTVEVYWAFIDKFRDGERPGFASWYLENIRPRLERSPLSSVVARLDISP